MKTGIKNNWRNCTFVVRSFYSGQRSKVSDYIHKWVIDVEGNVSEKDVVDYAFEQLWGHGRLPEFTTWTREVSDIGEHFTDLEYFQNGFYEITKEKDAYVFQITMPTI